MPLSDLLEPIRLLGESLAARPRDVADGNGHRSAGGEERSALLAARGRRNDEIAAALELSPKTVEWNLTRIYRKLGVRSRTELAIRLASEDAQWAPE